MGIDRSLEYVHTLSIGHRHLVAASRQCGCFYCCTIFPPTEITEWVDGDEDAGVTALCPRCGIDAVLPDPPIEVTLEFLRLMNSAWFQ